VANPKVIVEVLSTSTAGVDRQEKRIAYREIAELEEYLIVAQESAQVTIFRRSESWQPVILDSLEESLELRSVGLTIPLAQIYEGEW
jgi:Uma2 family endonuclease